MANKSILDLDYAKYDFKDPEKYVYKSEKGLSRQTVEQISDMKKEPEWMKKFRLRAYEHFLQRPMPTWGGNLSHIDFNDIYYYLRPTDKVEKSWDDVPEKIKKTFDRLGIPEAEKKFLAGVGAQYECLSGDSRVYTLRGPVPIRDVNPGDTVFSFDETTDSFLPSKVIARAFKGEREVFSVQVGTRVIETTINHPFLVLDHRRLPGQKRGRYYRKWKYLHEIHPGDLVGIPKLLPDVGQPHTLSQPLIQTIVAGHNQYVQYDLDVSHSYNEIELPTETTPDLMWFLGLYLGDGFIHHDNGSNKARVEVAVPASDHSLRDEFAKVAQRLFGLNAHDKDPTRLTLYSTILARYIEDNGFAGTAHSKSIPQWVFALPQEQILAFIGGYVDSDGFVRDTVKNHDISITSVNKNLLEGTKALCAICGLPTSNINRFESKHPFDTTRTMVAYRMLVSGSFERIASRSLQRTRRFGRRKYYHDFTSSKGTKFAKHTNKFIGFAKVKSIVPLGTKPVYDIEVEGPHNFVAEGVIVHNSEVVYHSLLKHLEDKGVIFCDTDTAVKQHPEIVKKYFGTIIPPEDNKMAALNSAVWSGGSFIYVPEGVKVDLPLQAYFRINAANMGQFERTLIIADNYADVQYIEGCTAPVYSTDALHSAVVEIIAKKGARVRYTTLQNWSSDVYNLVTKRAYAYEDASVEWIDANVGSKLTMKYPSVYLVGPRAKAEIVSVAFAGRDRHQDTGAKAVHLAPYTSSRITAKSVSKDGGLTTYRGLVHVAKGAVGVKSSVRCDALLMDAQSKTSTYPYMEVNEDDATITHEATVGRINEDQLFYLMSRGLTETQALSMIVTGFMEPFTRVLPMEYAVEFNRLIEMEMEGAVG